MKRIAYLTSADMVPGGRGSRDDLFELELQLAQLVPAFAERGLRLELVVWSDPDTVERLVAGDFDAVVIGTPWDYQDHHEVSRNHRCFAASSGVQSARGAAMGNTGLPARPHTGRGPGSTDDVVEQCVSVRWRTGC